ncbi:DUF2911 domain-containing protein [Mucilaginibacter antarcticus]|uniref:DUF2911 domain-containing protein n=1 Tax=Mucilaginibacter antarcticus TaxID=1855725 RepID=A0ABW5XUQ9_9SPHI
MKRKLLAFALLFSAATTNIFAQSGPRIPEASSSQTITQGLGLGTITLTYARPNVKGRKIFGGLEPYGAVWRTGANYATTIKFTEDVTLEGKTVAAGEYGLFTIPGQTEWTIIINKNAKQWGAYTYKEADDVLRVKVKAVKSPIKMETFGMQFINVTPKTAELWLAWDNVLVPVKLTIDDDAKITANIDRIMSGPKKNYFGAIQYYHDNKTAKADLEKALVWAEEAQKSDPKAPYYILWKARLLLKLGRKSEARATANEGVKMATDQKNDEYIRLNQDVANKAK